MAWPFFQLQLVSGPHLCSLHASFTPSTHTVILTKDVDPRCVAFLKQQQTMSGHFGHIFGDLFGMLSSATMLPRLAWCHAHSSMCEPATADCNVTGTPCQDFAPNGNRQGVSGPQWPTFMAWATLVMALDIAIVVHENVPQFNVQALISVFSSKYIIYSFIVDCSDVGFYLISRKRRFTIMYHKAKAVVNTSPVLLHSRIKQAFMPLQAHMAIYVSACFLASAEEIGQEIEDLCLLRGISVHEAMQDMAMLLSPGEAQRLAAYEELWLQRFGQPACSCDWAIFNLADNPDGGFTTWSAASGRIPGLRTHNAKYWVPFLGRWLTNKELLAAMGVPVYPSLANAACVPVVAVTPGPAARHMLGNMMHIASVGSVIACALACGQLV
jgi:site-specific DNA-cytosine methylase